MIVTIRNKQTNKYKAFIDVSPTVPLEMYLTDFKLNNLLDRLCVSKHLRFKKEEL